MSEADDWFMREVLPLEATLVQFLRQNWRNWSDIADLRQEVYMRVYEAAQKKIPEQTRAFVLTTARNIVIDRVRQERVIPIEMVIDFMAAPRRFERPTLRLGTPLWRKAVVVRREIHTD